MANLLNKQTTKQFSIKLTQAHVWIYSVNRNNWISCYEIKRKISSCKVAVVSKW